PDTAATWAIQQAVHSRRYGRGSWRASRTKNSARIRLPPRWAAVAMGNSGSDSMAGRGKLKPWAGSESRAPRALDALGRETYDRNFRASGKDAGMERTKYTGDTVTQMHLARTGVVTPEMARVAEREGVEPELIRSEVAR